MYGGKSFNWRDLAFWLEKSNRNEHVYTTCALVFGFCDCGNFYKQFVQPAFVRILRNCRLKISKNVISYLTIHMPVLARYKSVIIISLLLSHHRQQILIWHPLFNLNSGFRVQHVQDRAVPDLSFMASDVFGMVVLSRENWKGAQPYTLFQRLRYMRNT